MRQVMRSRLQERGRERERERTGRDKTEKDACKCGSSSNKLGRYLLSSEAAQVLLFGHLESAEYNIALLTSMSIDTTNGEHRLALTGSKQPCSFWIGTQTAPRGGKERPARVAGKR